MTSDAMGRDQFAALRRDWEDAHREFATLSRVVLISTNADQRVAVPAVPVADLEAWEAAKDRLDRADAALREAFRSRSQPASPSGASDLTDLPVPQESAAAAVVDAVELGAVSWMITDSAECS